jgi:hypothetical protein
MAVGNVKSIEKTQKTSEPSSATRGFARRPSIGISQGTFDTALVPQMAGNLAVQRLFRAGAFRAKLAISQSGDPDEEEADRIAEQVVSSAPTRTISRKCAACAADVTTCPKCEEEEKLRRKEKPSEAPQSTPAMHSQISPLLGGGQPLPSAMRSFFEPRFGQDFSGVRIHTNTQATEFARGISARAFTIGENVVFGASEYTPESQEGMRLIAHELSHVVQNVVALSPAVIQRQPSSASPSAPTTGGMPRTGPAPDPDGHAKPMLAKPPDPKGELVVHSDSNVTFTDNPEYVRYQLEKFLADEGLARIGVFESKDSSYRFGSGLGPFLDSDHKPVTPERTEYLKRVIQVVRQEVKDIRHWIGEFTKDFQLWAVNTACKILDDSKARIEKERDRYGIKSEAKKFLGITYGTRHTMAESQETADLAKAAGAMLAKDQVFRDALDKFSHYQSPNTPPSPYRDPETAAGLALQRDAAKKKLDEAENDYNILRGEKEAEHPILAAYRLEPYSPNTSSILATLASGTSEGRAETLGEQIVEKLEKNEDARKKISENQEKIWGLPSILAATKEIPEIANWPHLGPLLRGTVISEEVGARGALDDIVKLVLDALSIALSLIPHPVARAAAGGLAIYIGKKAYEEFQFKQASEGTDFEKAKAISQEEPSLFWVALDIVVAFAGAKEVVKEGAQLFRLLTGLRREARAAKAAVETAKASGQAADSAERTYQGTLKRLEAEGDGVKNGLGKRLKEEILQAPAETAAQAAERKAVQAGEEVGSPMKTAAGMDVKLSKQGHLFTCSSPCTILRDRYGAILAKNEDMANKVADLERRATDATEKAKKAMEVGDAAARAEAETLANTVKREATALEKDLRALLAADRAPAVHAAIQALAARFPILGTLSLDVKAVERILQKAPNLGHMKGQILEELLARRIPSLLADAAQRAKLAGEKAAQQTLEFIEGHRITSMKRKQFTDGVLAIHHPDGSWEVVTIFESKAGRGAFRGLERSGKSLAKMTEEELKQLREVAIEELIEKHPELESLSIAEIEKAHAKEIDRIMKDIPRTESGQIRRDIERLIPEEGETTTPIRIDGEPAQVSGSLQKTRIVGVLPSDVSVGDLPGRLKKEGLQFQALDMDITAKDLNSLAGEILGLMESAK